MAIDFVISGWATKLFVIRMVAEHDIKIQKQEQTIEAYNYIYKNEKNKWITGEINKLWGNEKMIKTFPNLKIQDVNGNIVYLDSLLPEIQPYYYKVFDKKLN